MDTPFKKFGDTLGFLGVSSGNFVSTSNVFRKAGFGGSSSSSFNLRRANSVMYDTKDFGGIQAEVSYSVGDPLENAITGQRKPVVWSGGIKYEVGPLYLAAAHEIHNDLYGGSRNVPQGTISNLVIVAGNFNADTVRSKDRATQLTAQYKLGIHTIEADYIRKEYTETGAIAAGHFTSYTNNAFLVSLESRWSNAWRTQINAIKATKGSCELAAGVACTTDGLDGTQYSVGAAYYLDPSFYIFGLYAILNNGASAQYNNAPSSQATPNPGEDIRQIAVGIAYIF
jgi:predicted porin